MPPDSRRCLRLQRYLTKQLKTLLLYLRLRERTTLVAGKVDGVF